MKLLVCGDRNWTDAALIHAELKKRPNVRLLIHGAAPGADTLAGKAAVECGIRVKAIPADWKRYGRAAGPIRNAAMLKEIPHLVLAFHDDIKHSKGTKNMIAQAYKAGVPYKLISHKALL